MLKNLALAAAAFLVSFLAIEGVFRVLDHNVPLITRYDPNTGFANAAGVSGWTKSESIERVTLDEHGLRVSDDGVSAARPKKKPDGVFRIAVLGDSYTESFYVAFEDSFPRVLERELRACAPAGRSIEVLNFGVSGFSNVQELMMYRHRVQDFEPDLVLLVVHLNNDLRNNFRRHEQNPFIPYAEFRNGRLSLDESFRDDPAFQSKLRWSNLRNDLVNYSWALQFAVAAVGRWRQGIWHDERVRNMPTAPAVPAAPGGAPAPSAGAASAPPVQVDDLDAIFRPGSPVPPVYEQPEHLPPARASDEILWRLAEAVILQLQREVEASGARLWLTSTATGVAIAPDERARAAFLEAHGVPDTDYGSHRLAKFAATAKLGFIPLASALRTHAITSGVDLEWFEQRGGVRGHWIAAGHAVAGQTLARELCAARVVDQVPARAARLTPP